VSGKRFMLGAAAAGLTALALLLGGVLRESSSAAPASTPVALAPQTTAELVAKAQATVRANPYSVAALDQLGLL